MKENISSKYTFNLADRKKVKILKGGELDFDNMNKGYYDEIESKDSKIKDLRKSLENTKNWSIKHSVYANMELPKTWKNKMEYPQEILKLVSTDQTFFNYLSKVNSTARPIYEMNSYKGMVDFEKMNNDKIINANEVSTLMDFKGEQVVDNKISKKNSFLLSPIKISNITKTSNKYFINPNINNEEINEIDQSIKLTRNLSIQPRRRTLIYTNRRIFNEKQKREILDNYKELYKIKKTSNVNEKVSSGPKINLDTGQYNLPNIVSSNRDNFLDSTQKSKMFQSSIYNLLIPNKSEINLNKANNNLSQSHQNFNGTINSLKSRNKNNKANTTKTDYGPFLNFNYAEFNKKIEIQNPKIKKILEDIDYYGPYFSHCPTCKNKNLEFYQTMEPHHCLNILNYLKKTRKKNKNTLENENKSDV